MPVDRSTPDAVLHAVARRPLLFDGAMGSTLNDFPERDWEAPEEVTLRFPDRMAGVYQAYLDAGADVLSTNTFGGNLIRLERAGLTEKSEAINRGAAEQARAVAGDDAWVAGDIGQSGDFLVPLGDITEARMSEAFRVQAEQLAEGGADLILCETFSDIREVQIAIDAASSTGLPVLPP